jgi:hypothetical protein
MLKQYDAWTRKYASARKADTSDDDDNGNGEQHLIGQLADLLAEAGSSDGEVTREQALRWLLHSKEGQSLIARLAPYRKQIDAAHRKRATNRKGFQMTRDETLRSMTKMHGGVHGLAKRIIRDGTTDITEHELTGLIVDAAKREYPDLSDAQAFAKAFGAAGPNGDTLRRAIAITKQVNGDDDNDDDAAAALEELHRLADAHHRKHPELTPEGAFARVFADPRNAALAHRAHKRPVANRANSFPFPR